MDVFSYYLTYGFSLFTLSSSCAVLSLSLMESSESDGSINSPASLMPLLSSRFVSFLSRAYVVSYIRMNLITSTYLVTRAMPRCLILVFLDLQQAK